jgi:hypothetical protein
MKKQQRGVLLGYILPHHNNSKLRKDDLVQRNDGYDNNYYNIIKVDELSINAYYLESKENGELINFSKDELIKCHYAFFDYNSYYKERKMILLGSLSIMDLNYIKAKKAHDLDLGYNEMLNLSTSKLLGLDFNGYIENQNIIEDSDPNQQIVISKIAYFKINKPN